MLSHARVADYLKLTPEQQQALANTSPSAMRSARAGDQAAGDEAEFNQKAQAVLSETQRELWANLLGAPVRFAAASGPAKTRDAQTQRAAHADNYP